MMQQQYKNPFDREARAEQFDNAAETMAAENAAEKRADTDPSATGARTIEIVEENEAGQSTRPTEQPSQESSESGQQVSSEANSGQTSEGAQVFNEAQDAENAQNSGEAEGAQTRKETQDSGDAQDSEESQSDAADLPPQEDSLQGDVQYTGPLFGGTAAQVESEEIAALKAEIKNLRLRQAAEMENFKKRLAREHQEQMLYASEKVLSDLLPTLDNLELAMQYGNTNEVCKDILTGISMTHKLLLDCVQKHGLTPVGTVGEAFDPAIHEAVGFDPKSDQEKGCVARVLQRGYKLGNRLLRPARIMISQPAE